MPEKFVVPQFIDNEDKILGPITIGRNARVGANSVVIESVMRDATVVGIPAKIVHRDIGRCTFDGRINLNHHLMPDPVGEAFSVLLDRVEFLETRVSHLQRRLRERERTIRAPDGAAPKAEPAEVI